MSSYTLTSAQRKMVLQLYTELQVCRSYTWFQKNITSLKPVETSLLEVSESFSANLPYLHDVQVSKSLYSQPPPFLACSLFIFKSFVNMRGAMAMDINSWKRSLHAYGMCTCPQKAQQSPCQLQDS